MFCKPASPACPASHTSQESSDCEGEERPDGHCEGPASFLEISRAYLTLRLVQPPHNKLLDNNVTFIRLFTLYCLSNITFCRLNIKQNGCHQEKDANNEGNI